jgi:hypothetical protein
MNASDENQQRMGCPVCHGVGLYDKTQDRFFCMDCGFDSTEDLPNVTLDSRLRNNGDPR